MLSAFGSIRLSLWQEEAYDDTGGAADYPYVGGMRGGFRGLRPGAGFSLADIIGSDLSSPRCVTSLGGTSGGLSQF